MKYFRLILTIVLLSISLNVMAQTKKVQDVEKDNARAKVELVNGQRVLVLKTGRTSAFHNPDIHLKIEDDTWKRLDSLVVAPWGSTIVVKDVDGHKVNIAKANVNSRLGLMFTSGTKFVAITGEVLKSLRN